MGSCRPPNPFPSLLKRPGDRRASGDDTTTHKVVPQTGLGVGVLWKVFFVYCIDSSWGRRVIYRSGRPLFLRVCIDVGTFASSLCCSSLTMMGGVACGAVTPASCCDPRSVGEEEEEEDVRAVLFARCCVSMCLRRATTLDLFGRGVMSEPLLCCVKPSGDTREPAGNNSPDPPLLRPQRTPSFTPSRAAHVR